MLAAPAQHGPALLLLTLQPDWRAVRKGSHCGIEQRLATAVFSVWRAKQHILPPCSC